MAQSSRDQAQQGLELIKEAVLGILRTKDDGESASEIGKALGIHDSRRNGQNGYVAWTALGHLMADGKVRYDEPTRLYFLV